MSDVPAPSKAPLETITHAHPSLGTIKGRLFSQCHADGTPITHPVAHFRSIPYATIPSRFKASVLCENGLPDDFDERPKGDFTQYGYACPSVPQPRDGTGGYLPGEEIRRYDEDACLNLTISAPVSKLPTEGSPPAKLLPVMVYIHGGGLMEGAGHVSALHETVKMAELAVREDMGIIAVNIGYRLNYFGFLACNDLLEEREGDGPVLNLGLRDQRNAFYWIKKHIAGFGGDPDNITAFGESGGSASISFHLCSTAPIFKRAILQSATIDLFGLGTLEAGEKVYQNLLRYLSIEAGTAAERLAALRAVPSSRLVDAIRDTMNLNFYHCGDDTDFFPQKTGYDLQGQFILSQSSSWVESIIVGDTAYEGYMFHGIMKFARPSIFTQKIIEIFGEIHGKVVLEKYEIPTDGDIDTSLFQTRSMELLGDVFFAEPNDRLARRIVQHQQEQKPTIYRYCFGLPNPFPGTQWSFAMGHHFVDLMYMFMTATRRYPTWRNKFHERQSVEFARRWIKFGNGIPPWTAYSLPAGDIAICDYTHGWSTRTQVEDELVSQEDPWGPRRYSHRKAISEAWEAVYRSAGGGEEGLWAVEKARGKVVDVKSFMDSDESVHKIDMDKVHAG